MSRNDASSRASGAWSQTATLQVGIGSLAAAIYRALAGYRDLAVRSTLARGWLLDLAASGALHPDAAVISEAGSAELYKYVAASNVAMRSVREVIGPQPEYLRAAQRSAGRCAIVALPATAGTRSRIVPRLQPATVNGPSR